MLRDMGSHGPHALSAALRGAEHRDTSNTSQARSVHSSHAWVPRGHSPSPSDTKEVAVRAALGESLALGVGVGERELDQVASAAVLVLVIEVETGQISGHLAGYFTRGVAGRVDGMA
jgi:hypothetical protein